MVKYYRAKRVNKPPFGAPICWSATRSLQAILITAYFIFVVLFLIGSQSVHGGLCVAEMKSSVCEHLLLQ